jgi:hypothetical protein
MFAACNVWSFELPHTAIASLFMACLKNHNLTWTISDDKPRNSNSMNARALNDESQFILAYDMQSLIICAFFIDRE